MGISKQTFWVIAYCSLGLSFAFCCAGQQLPGEFFKQGVERYHQSDWDGAITNFTRSIENSYKLYESYNNRAYARAKKGDSNGAIADCNQAVSFNRNFSGAYYWRARVEFVLTNYDRAFLDFQFGMKLNSKDRPEDLSRDLSGVFREIVDEKFKAGDLESALTNLNRAIIVCPTNWSSYATRGFWNLLGHNYTGAIADEDIAIRHLDEMAFPFDVRAWARYESNDVSGADADCKRALEIYTKARSKETNKERLAESEFQSLLAAGLQDYINSDFEGAAQKWDSWLDQVDKYVPSSHKLPSIIRAYFQKWRDKAQEKAQAKLKDKGP